MNNPRHHRLIYVSSPDRGLDILLPMWPKIRAKFPDATLEIYYGFNLFEAAYRDNAERMRWMNNLLEQCKQDGITYVGRVGKQQLKEAEQRAGIWTYPTYFPEIFCISAMDCQLQGVVPVVMNYAALKETVQSGVKVDGDIFDKEVQEKWLDELLKLMGDEKRWQKESEIAKKVAKDYSWDKISDLWLKEVLVK